MAKYLKLFENNADYAAFIETEDFIRPNVSHCVQENDVHYNEEQRIIVKFNVTSTDTPTKLTYNGTSLAKISKIEIDGAIIEPIAETYTFDTVGEHIVKYTLVNPSEIFINLFRGCDGITEVRIPKNIETISGNAFNGCTNLTKINIPNSVEAIGVNAFANCTSLPVVDNVRYADTYVVGVVDNSLTSCTINDGATWIGNKAFYNYANLAEITIPSSVEKIDIGAFQRSGLVNVVIPDSVASFGTSVFSGCKNLESAIIGNGITIMPDDTFAGCANLTNVVIPNSVTNIDRRAFNGCTNLASVTIPNSVTAIENTAFSDCISLGSITSLAIIAPSIANNAFLNVKTGGTLYVPQGSTGYDVWMGTGDYYLGKYNWTKVEQ